jgi:hypothetical protein
MLVWFFPLTPASVLPLELLVIKEAKDIYKDSLNNYKIKLLRALITLEK